MAGRFGSVMTAMVTPFARGSRRSTWTAPSGSPQWLVDNGSDAIVVAGSTGEAPTLTHREKSELFRAVGETVRGRAKLICGTGTYSTAETLELTQAAEDAGADGLLVVTPYYNKPPQRGLLAHFESVAGATDLPIIAYNIPGRTATRIEHDTLLRLAEIPNIVAVKDSTGDFQGISKLIAEAPDGFEVYSRRRLGDLRLRVPGCRRRRERREPPGRSTDPSDGRPGRDRRHAAAAQDPRGALAAVQRAVRDVEPHPAEGRPGDGRAGPRASRACRSCRRPRRSASGFAKRWRMPALLCVGRCRIVFLGGVGEVGRNMACLELGDRILIVDVGLSFPSADMPGIDLVLPDLEYLRERAGDVEAIVLTHGHEDHVGALPYLLKELGRLPVFATAFTLELLKGKLEEHEVTDLAEELWRSRATGPAPARSRCGSST